MRNRLMLIIPGLWLVLLPCSSQEKHFSAPSIPAPVIEEDWWTIAGNPDLGPLNGDGQFPTAFCIWPARDGSWQLLSCVRGTQIGGKTRLLHRWQGSSLTDSSWTAMGVLLTADPAFNETEGGLQAPYVFSHEEGYLLFYGDWENICLAGSEDGKTFARKLTSESRSAIYSHGAGINTKDPYIIRIKENFHLYYAAVENNSAAIYGAKSEDLIKWSEPVEGIRIIHYNNTYFIASLKPGLTGTRLARLRWVTKN